MISREAFEGALVRMVEPLKAFFEAPDVTEILLNGAGEIFVERSGRLQRIVASGFSDASLVGFLRLVAQYSGRAFDDDNPILEARLPDGSRIEAVLPPLVEGGPHVAIRRHHKRQWSLEGLVSLGSIAEGEANLLRSMVRSKRNLLVAGGTGTGKTSVLSSLAAAIDEVERIVVIEDAREISLSNPHVVALEARPSREEDGRAPITIRDLFRATLRMRPDRVVIGEVRGGEALDLLLAMTSGHGGCLSTIHASSPRLALERLETLAMMGGLAIDSEVAKRLVASAIGGVVQVDRAADGRRFVSEIALVEGMSPEGYLVRNLGGASHGDGS